MATQEALRQLCLDEKGQPKEKNECRAVIINHLILDGGLDIDEAEELAENTLRESHFWDETKPQGTEPVV